MPIPERSEAFAALNDATVVCSLAHLGSLCFDGPEAAVFLHGQLSSDVQALQAGAAQWSSYNSPKGRVLANLLVWRAPGDGGFEALLAADLAAAVARRLAMFVLRAKVSVRDVATERVRIGLAGPGAKSTLRAVLGAAPDAHCALEHDGVTLLGLRDGRVILAVAAERASALQEALAAHGTVADEDVWRWTRIAAGIPLITASTTDRFVPQALNWEVLGGVSFQKGCYPGQEIVARMQYLGRLKERLFAFRLAASPPAAGTRLYAASFGDQPCGTVIEAAPHPDGGAALLAVVQRSAAEGDVVHAGAPDGVPMTIAPLPYAVPEPAPVRGRMA
jgi:folate-binding protein YgfZ